MLTKLRVKPDKGNFVTTHSNQAFLGTGAATGGAAAGGAAGGAAGEAPLSALVLPL